ncbi:MAG TPA: hypothetical protein VL091_07755 [Marinobacter sp.]|nr:hypothetical protein [Marinobacter sp.]
MKRFFLLVMPLLLLSGCASYYSHYAMLPAQNSAGEARQVRLSWDTAEYPGWWLASDKSTAILLETQCSERAWRLYDDSHKSAGVCGDGIRACGQPGLDLHALQGGPVTEATRCLSVNPSDKRGRIAELGNKFDLLVSCEPVAVSQGEGDDKRNMDYIRASSVPYTVYVRKAPRGSFLAKMPAFDKSECDAE